MKNYLLLVNERRNNNCFNAYDGSPIYPFILITSNNLIITPFILDWWMENQSWSKGSLETWSDQLKKTGYVKYSWLEYVWCKKKLSNDFNNRRNDYNIDISNPI